MTYRASDVKVGLVVLASIALLIIFVVAISGVHFHRETVFYTTRLDWVGGLDVGTPVRLGGVRIGRIAQVTFPKPGDRQIELLLEVKKGAPIKTDSRAYLTSIGLMGEFYVEIMPGSPEAPVLPPGSEIPSLPSTTFSQLSMRMGELSGSAETLLENVNRLLDPRNPDGLAALVGNLNGLVATNSEALAATVSALRADLVELNRLLLSLRETVEENRSGLRATIHDLDSTLASTQRLVQSLQTTAEAIRTGIGSNAGDLQAALRNLERATRNLEAFSLHIRQNPWSLVRKSYPKPRELP